MNLPPFFAEALEAVRQRRLLTVTAPAPLPVPTPPHLPVEPAAVVEETAARSEDEGVYLPTPEQISAACAEIQAGWSSHEHQQRQGLLSSTGLANIPRIRRLSIGGAQ